MTMITTYNQIMLLHGWGAHPAVFGDFATCLEQFAPVTNKPLPGYSDSPWSGSQQMIETLKPDTLLIGWSLGGLHAIEMSAYSPHVRGLILIASLPCFITDKRVDNQGVTRHLLAQLEEKIYLNPQDGLDFFWKMHSVGGAAMRRQYRELKNRLGQQPIPDVNTLLAGLNKLKKDTQGLFNSIRVPILTIGGKKDPLIIYSDMNKQTKKNEKSMGYLIDEAGHIPFITHQEHIIKKVAEFIKNT